MDVNSWKVTRELPRYGTNIAVTQFHPLQPRVLLAYYLQFGPDGYEIWGVEKEERLGSGPGVDSRLPVFTRGSRRLTLFDSVGVRIVDALTGAVVQTFEDSNPSLRPSITPSPDGARVAYVVDKENRLIRIRSTISRNPPVEIKEIKSQVYFLAFDPEGKTLASCHADGTVHLWDATTGQEIRALKASDSGTVNSAAFSPDGKLLATGGADKTVRVFDAQSGECRFVLSGHTAAVTSVAFTPLGKRLASGSYDGTVRVWDPKTGKQIQELAWHRLTVTSVSFSCDGQVLASASTDGTVGLWGRGSEEAAESTEKGKEAEVTARTDALPAQPSGERSATTKQSHKDDEIATWRQGATRDDKGAPSDAKPETQNPKQSFDDVYVTTAATGDKISHPLSRKTYHIIYQGRRIDVPEGMVYIPAGESLMGEGNEPPDGPEHRVYLDSCFVGKYEVTNAEWKAFLDGASYPVLPLHWKEGKVPDGKENHPVVNVSWEDVQKYCEWVSREAGSDVRLPTDAQWEKAARGKKGLKYAWGNDFDKRLCNSAWMFESWGFSPVEGAKLNSDLQLWEWLRKTGKAGELIASGGNTMPVGSFPQGKSPFGCFDMVGNVFEWCVDWYSRDYYRKSPRRNPEGPSEDVAETDEPSGKTKDRVMRSSSWQNHRSKMLHRCSEPPSKRMIVLGFRIVCIPEKK